MTVLQWCFCERGQLTDFTNPSPNPNLHFMWSFKYLVVVYVFPHSLQEWWDQVCSAAGPLVSRWLTGFTNALQSGDKKTPRREVGERQRSCSCTEHLAGENLYIAGAGNVYNSLLVRPQVGVYWSLCTVVHCMMLPSLSCGFQQQQQQWCCSKRNSWLVACLPICCTFDMERKRWSSAKLM